MFVVLRQILAIAQSLPNSKHPEHNGPIWIIRDKVGLTLTPWLSFPSSISIDKKKA